MSLPTLQALAEVLTERLLNTAVEGIILAALAWILLRLIASQNPGTRFAVWFSTLVSIAALPCFSSALGSSPFPGASLLHLHKAVLLPAWWAPALLATWVAGTAVLLFRLGVGLWRVHQLRKNCTELDLGSADLRGLDPAVARRFQTYASRRRVRLCVSTEVAVPAALGFFRPAIVFPAGLLPQLSAAEVEVVVLHELAHLRRWDDWTNLAQKILKALFFFHPAVWWIETRLTLEREMACDDMVVEQTSSPKAYASSLISFAEKLQNARALAMAQALVSRMQQMSLRVAQILDAKRARRTSFWKPVLGVSAGLLAMVFGTASYMPRLVAFQPAKAPVRVAAIRPARAFEPRLAVIPVGARQREQQPSLLLPHRQAIPVVFHPKTFPVPRELKVRSSRRPAIIPAPAPPEMPVRETLIILRATGYGAFGSSGSPVWTLCIWTVEGKNIAESTIVTGSI